MLRTNSRPSRSKISQCCRLTSGWAIVTPASRLRPITVGNFSDTARLFALPLTTTSLARMGRSPTA